MTALIGAVFIASLLGSLHCAGMCGAFATIAVTTPTVEGRAVYRQARLHIAYNAGRLLTYSLLGAAAGVVGAGLELGGATIGIQRSAAVAAGVMMVMFGVVAVLRLRGVRLPQVPMPASWRAIVSRGHRAAAGLSPMWRASIIGLLTTLLPCGWLYAFAITAAGTASPLWGAVTMAAFWAGTLPVLVAVGAGVQRLAGPLRRQIPAITSVALVAVGVYTIVGRGTMPAAAMTGGVVRAGDTDAAIDRVQHLDSSEMPCCQHHR